MAFISLFFFIGLACGIFSFLSFLVMLWNVWKRYKKSHTPGAESGQYMVDDDGITYHLLYGEGGQLYKGHAVGDKPKNKRSLRHDEPLPKFGVFVGEDGDVKFDVGDAPDESVAVPLERLL